ncbi:MAG TPA: ABATE domain-containing protein [Pilimelia sp.]|nr:ABATE domain-containing protein [Pilimelia sp.]
MPTDDVPPPLPPLYGGVLCLDFANTVDSRAALPLEEHLHGYPDLLRWARFASVLDDASADRLARAADARPAAAQASHARAVELREAIFRVFAALAAGAAAAPADLAIVNRAYADAIGHADLVPAGAAFDWAWAGDDLDLAWWPVARSVVDLLTGGTTERVKVCASEEGCAGLFFDTTKNHSRRWCTMGACGVEVKVKRQTARRRAARTGGRVDG